MPRAHRKRPQGLERPKMSSPRGTARSNTGSRRRGTGSAQGPPCSCPRRLKRRATPGTADDVVFKGSEGQEAEEGEEGVEKDQEGSMLAKGKGEEGGSERGKRSERGTVQILVLRMVFKWNSIGDKGSGGQGKVWR